MVNTFNIVTTVFNAEEYIEQCIQSVLDQSCQNWQMVIVNDGSVDKTLERAQRAAKGEHRITIIDVSRRKGICNSHKLAHNSFSDMGDDDIFVHLDGDDRLLHSRVLEAVARAYEQEGVEATYGSYVSASGKVCVARPVVHGSIRDQIKYGWPFTHLRTFRASLWQYVHDWDLRDKDGNYYTAAVDVAIMCPVLEAAKTVAYITEPLYFYNDNTGLNEHSTALMDQARCALDIAAKHSE